MTALAAPRLRVLAVSGSLRAGSTNTAALQALATVAPCGVSVTLFEGLRSVPPFDPDQDGESLPAPVAALRQALGAADALVISSPEYARGVSGVLKNALDWLVGGAEMPGKRVGLVNTSTRAVHAPAALRLTLDTMAARVIEAACVTLPLLGRTLDAAAIAADPLLAEPLRDVLTALDDAQ